MNQHFQKALYLLDFGEYSKGEEALKTALETASDPWDEVAIKACYAELLYEQDRIDESMTFIETVLNSGDEYEYTHEKEIVTNIKQKINEVYENLPGENPPNEKPSSHIKKTLQQAGRQIGNGVVQAVSRIHTAGKKEYSRDNRKSVSTDIEPNIQYFRIWTEKENNTHYKGIDENNCKKLFPYLFDGKSYADSWDSSVTICINAKKPNIEYTDVPMFATNFFIVNEKVLNLFLQYAEGEFEALNINCLDGNYVLVNVTDTVDCIDMEQSVYKVWKGAKDEIQSYDKLYLIKDRLNGKNLFRAKHTGESFFLCSDTLKNAIENSGIIGLNFELID